MLSCSLKKTWKNKITSIQIDKYFKIMLVNRKQAINLQNMIVMNKFLTHNFLQKEINCGQNRIFLLNIYAFNNCITFMYVNKRK